MINRVTLLVTVFVSALAVGADQSVLTPAEEMVRQEAQRGGYQLIGVDDLLDLYQDPSSKVLLIDTRQDWEFRTGHIKNSIHFSMEPTWFARLIQRHPLAQKLGSDKDQILVFY